MKEANKKIIEYYNRNQISYGLFWMNKTNLAMHYGFWDEDTRNLHEALINQNRYVAEALDIQKGDTVLDAGCGVGGTAIWIAENYGASVTGITIVEKQVSLAEKYARKRGVDKLVRFELRDFCDTGLPDESFDKIYAMESACYSPDKSEFLKEAFRILKRGGKIVIADAFLRGNIVDDRDSKILDLWCEGWAVPNVLTAEDFRSMAEGAGFKVCKWNDMTKNITRSSRVIHKIGRMFFPLDWTLHRMRLVSKETFNSTRASCCQLHLFQNIMSYDLVALEKA